MNQQPQIQSSGMAMIDGPQQTGVQVQLGSSTGAFASPTAILSQCQRILDTSGHPKEAVAFALAAQPSAYTGNLAGVLQQVLNFCQITDWDENGWDSVYNQAQQQQQRQPVGLVVPLAAKVAIYDEIVNLDTSGQLQWNGTFESIEAQQQDQLLQQVRELAGQVGVDETIQYLNEQISQNT